MNKKMVASLLGKIVMLEGICMMPAAIISFVNNERKALIGFIISFTILETAGFILSYKKPKEDRLYSKEGFTIVALGWIGLSLFGALPFFISGEIPNFVDAFFETVSGFTTTGATIVSNIETMPYGLVYWRSFLQWLGGMGVLVFLLAIVPSSKGSGYSLNLIRAEAPGPEFGKIAPKVSQVAKILYSIYIGLTLIEIVFLIIGGMSMFDSVVVSFSTAGTGGFAPKNASIGAYDSAYIEYVVTIFMVVFGTNFNVIYLILIKDFKTAFKDEELRVYYGIYFLSVLAVWINISPIYGSIGEAFRHSAFHTSSIMTSSGFSAAGFETWPQFSKSILILLMVVGASAGSAAGGVKCMRWIIIAKYIKYEIKKIVRPNSIDLIKINDKIVDDKVIHGVNSYIGLYIIMIGISLLFISLDNFSFETTFTTVIMSINNIGIAFDGTSGLVDFSNFSWFSKMVISFNMLAGRLELFPMLMLFSPYTWKNK